MLIGSKDVNSIFNITRLKKPLFSKSLNKTQRYFYCYECVMSLMCLFSIILICKLFRFKIPLFLKGTVQPYILS
jgi:hypothetical protein